MKKNLSKKLIFSKSTVAHLNQNEQKMIKGGETCVATWDTDVCGTCVTQCGTCETACIPCESRLCETVKPIFCPTELCQ